MSTIKQLPNRIPRDPPRRSSIAQSISETSNSSYSNSLEDQKMKYRSNLSMIDESPTLTNHYRSTSFIMKSRSDPTIFDHRRYVTLNHSSAYETPIYMKKYHSNPYLVQHTIASDYRRMNRPTDPPQGYYYNVPPLMTYNNLYLAFLY